MAGSHTNNSPTPTYLNEPIPTGQKLFCFQVSQKSASVFLCKIAVELENVLIFKIKGGC